MDAKELGRQPVNAGEWDYINSNRAAANGITKREYFAGLAMQGILSSPEYLKALAETAQEKGIPVDRAVPMAACEYAGFLLAELAKEPTP